MNEQITEGKPNCPVCEDIPFIACTVKECINYYEPQKMENKEQLTLAQKLEEYFKNTPAEQIVKEWKEIGYEFSDINEPITSLDSILAQSTAPLQARITELERENEDLKKRAVHHTNLGMRIINAKEEKNQKLMGLLEIVVKSTYSLYKQDEYWNLFRVQHKI